MKDFQIRKHDAEITVHLSTLIMNSMIATLSTSLPSTIGETTVRIVSGARMNKMKPIGNGLYEGRIDRQTKGGSDDPRPRTADLSAKKFFDIALEVSIYWQQY